jgi:intraflagellar transport protein 80
LHSQSAASAALGGQGVWRRAFARAVRVLGEMLRLSCKVSRSQHLELVPAVAFSAGGSALLTCSDDGSVKRLDVEDLHGEALVGNLDGFPTDLAVCPVVANDKAGSDVMAVTLSDGSLRLLSGSTGREEKRVAAYGAGAAICVAWNEDGTALATGGEDGTVKVWSRAGMLRNTVASAQSPVYCVSWGRGDALLFSSGKLLTIEQKQHKQLQWKAHDGTVLAADWCLASNLIVSGGEDCRYRVWDAFGRQLFSSAPLEHVVTSLSWQRSGACFAVGAFGVLKVCDRTGWTLAREELPGCGSLLRLSWSADGTLLAAAGASGAVVVAEVPLRALEWKHVRAQMLDSKQVEVQDALEGKTEVLAFRERILDMSLDGGFLLVHTAAPQVHVFEVANLAAPVVVDVPVARSSVLVQGPRCFLAAWTVFSYEGRRLCSAQQAGLAVSHQQQHSGLAAQTVALNDAFLALLEPSHDQIRLVDLAKQKPVALIKHKLPLAQVALGEDDLLAFIDSNGDLFVQLTGRRTHRLPVTTVESVRFNAAGALVAACDGGAKLVTFFFPGVVWVDPDLLDETVQIVETPALAGRQPRILAFTDALVQLRDQSGAVTAWPVSRYPALLTELARARKWEDAVRLCRFVEHKFLWAVLAARALDKGHLDSAEIGLAALNAVAKLNYVLYIKDLPSEKARVAELALFKRDFKAAEQVLLQAHPPMLYRAVKLNLRIHRWERARQIAQPQPQLVRLVELYEKQWAQKQVLSGKELSELTAIKRKFSDKPRSQDAPDQDEGDEGADAQRPVPPKLDNPPVAKAAGAAAKQKAGGAARAAAESKRQDQRDEGRVDDDDEGKA